MLQNEYLVAKIGFDDVDKEPLQVWGVIQFNIQSGPYLPPGHPFSHPNFERSVLGRIEADRSD